MTSQPCAARISRVRSLEPESTAMIFPPTAAAARIVRSSTDSELNVRRTTASGSRLAIKCRCEAASNPPSRIQVPEVPYGLFESGGKRHLRIPIERRLRKGDVRPALLRIIAWQRPEHD